MYQENNKEVIGERLLRFPYTGDRKCIHCGVTLKWILSSIFFSINSEDKVQRAHTKVHINCAPTKS